MDLKEKYQQQPKTKEKIKNSSIEKSFSTQIPFIFNLKRKLFVKCLANCEFKKKGNKYTL